MSPDSSSHHVIPPSPPICEGLTQVNVTSHSHDVELELMLVAEERELVDESWEDWSEECVEES